VITCGEVPIDTDVPRVITAAADLESDNPGRWLADGVIGAENGSQSRGWFVYERLRKDLESRGASFADVVQQTVYLADVADYPALERVALSVFDGALPPTTVIPILDTSPFAEAKLEIDLIAFRENE